MSDATGRAAPSLMNEQEGKTAVSIVALLCQACPDYNFWNKIAIITPYKEQRRKIRKELAIRFGQEGSRGVEVSTVDGFQGQEREIVIFSCVRTGAGTATPPLIIIIITMFFVFVAKGGKIGFLTDARRMNVALTRAKCSLFILGKAQALHDADPLWRSLVSDAKHRNLIVPYDEEQWRQYGKSQYGNQGQKLRNLRPPL